MEGGKSEADLNSPNFDITLLEPKPRPSKSKWYKIYINYNLFLIY